MEIRMFVVGITLVVEIERVVGIGTTELFLKIKAFGLQSHEL